MAQSDRNGSHSHMSEISPVNEGYCVKTINLYLMGNGSTTVIINGPRNVPLDPTNNGQVQRSPFGTANALNAGASPPPVQFHVASQVPGMEYMNNSGPIGSPMANGLGNRSLQSPQQGDNSSVGLNTAATTFIDLDDSYLCS